MLEEMLALGRLVLHPSRTGENPLHYINCTDFALPHGLKFPVR